MIIDPVSKILDPAFKIFPYLDSPKARVLMLAIGLQESRFKHRHQVGGPAHGFWQFEKGGGVRGVLLHKMSAVLAVKVCHERGVGSSVTEVYDRLEHDDILAACFARLLLLTDPRPLPEIGEVEKAWGYYINNWRPGKPHRATWDDMYSKALDLVGGV